MASTGSTMPPKKEQQHIQVVVRCRPVNKLERNKGAVSAVECSGDRLTVRERNAPTAATKTFTFDRVFGPMSKQTEVYRAIVQPVVEEVLEGYNCTVFAYGQTGTGKTFTMIGERSDELKYSWEDDPLAGVIPRSLSHLFERLETNGCEFSVKVSFMELYNEELFDLLSTGDDTARLRLFDDANRKGSVVVQGLEEVVVSDKDAVYEIIHCGMQKRATATTLLNAQSSRSHSVFTVTVHMRENSVDGEELVKIGKLNLVDLAGSENIGRSGALEKRAREAGSINQSLLTLGRVITALVERTPHIPYRESKLTRILQDSLGGRTKTSIIATVTPASTSLEETLSTLDYAHRAKNIQNRPEVNQRLCKKALLKEYSDEVERLRRDLQAARDKNGFYMDMSNYARLQATLQQQRDRIQEQEDSVAAHRRDLEQLGDLLHLSRAEAEELAAARDRLEVELEATRALNRRVHRRWVGTEVARREEAAQKEAHRATEARLAGEAAALLASADASVGDVDALHAKVERLRETEAQHQARVRRLAAAVSAECEALKAGVESTSANLHAGTETVLSGLADHAAHLEAWCDATRATAAERTAAWQQEVSEVTATAAGHSAEAARSLDRLGDDAAALRTAQQQQLADLEAGARAGVSGRIGEACRGLARDLNSLAETSSRQDEEAAAGMTALVSARATRLDALGRAVTAAAAGLDQVAAQLPRQSAELEEQQCALEELARAVARLEERQREARERLGGTVAAVEETRVKIQAAGDLLSAAAAAGAGDLEAADRRQRESAEARRRDVAQAQTSCRALVDTDLPEVEADLTGRAAQTGRLLDERCSALAAGLAAQLDSERRRAADLEAALTQRLGPAPAVVREWLAERCRLLVTSQAEGAVQRLAAELHSARDGATTSLGRRRAEVATVEADVISALTSDLPPCPATGLTPARREFEYPRQLSRTSPQARLLQRIRDRIDVAEVAAACRIDELEEDEESSPPNKKRRPSSGIGSVCTQSSSHPSSPSCDNWEDGTTSKAPSNTIKVPKKPLHARN